MTYLSGAAGRAAYAKAAAASPRPADPQADLTGGPAALAVLAAYLRRCRCGESAVVHELSEAGNRTFCTLITAAGPCGCLKFTPGEEP